MTVGPRAGQREEQPTRRHCAGVEFDGAGDPGRSGLGGRDVGELATDDVGDLGQRQGDHARDLRASRRSGEFVAVVERPGMTAAGLARLVALPRDQHDIPGAGPRDGVVDGLTPIADLDDLRGAARRACEDRRPDRGGILVARVVVGHHNEVGELGRHLPIGSRLPGSRLPPAPNTTASRPVVCSRRVCSTACNAPGLWA